MTCIVGIVEDGKVYIGGDSAGVGSYNIEVRKDKKVFRNGPFLMGFTSSFRMGQLLQYKLNVARKPEYVDTMTFMVTTFIDVVTTPRPKGRGVVTIEKIKGPTSKKVY